jgi:excisionase family DNA binding protein
MNTYLENNTKFLLSSSIDGTSFHSLGSSFLKIENVVKTNNKDLRKKLFEIQIWTIDDLALALNCSKGSIYNKVSKDEIPFHKKGERGRLYFIPSEILEWIKEGDYR